MFLVSVLCSDRVTQMTKAYNDIEAVTRLLEEVRARIHAPHTYTHKPGFGFFLLFFFFFIQEEMKCNCAFLPVMASSVPIAQYSLCALISLQKERDLELAARIGQTLLEKNKELAEQNEILEEQVAEANEGVSGRDGGCQGGWA